MKAMNPIHVIFKRDISTNNISSLSLRLVFLTAKIKKVQV